MRTDPQSHSAIATKEQDRTAALGALTQLEGALFEAARGNPIIPIARNAKRPVLFSDWQSKATINPEVIKGWDAQWPSCNFARVHGPTICIDVDTKPLPGGGTGLEIWNLLWEGSLSETQRTRSANGGLHLTYRLPPGVKVSGGVNKFAQGIDIRGQGMYSLCPGSIVDGKVYRLESDAPIAMLDSSSLLRLLGEAKERPKADGASIGTVDLPGAIAHAIELAKTLPAAFTGQGGDEQAIRVINKIADQGVSVEVCREIMRSEERR